MAVSGTCDRLAYRMWKGCLTWTAGLAAGCLLLAWLAFRAEALPSDEVIANKYRLFEPYFGEIEAALDRLDSELFSCPENSVNVTQLLPITARSAISSRLGVTSITTSHNYEGGYCVDNAGVYFKLKTIETLGFSTTIEKGLVYLPKGYVAEDLHFLVQNTDNTEYPDCPEVHYFLYSEIGGGWYAYRYTGYCS